MRRERDFYRKTYHDLCFGGCGQCGSAGTCGAVNAIAGGGTGRYAGGTDHSGSGSNLLLPQRLRATAAMKRISGNAGVHATGDLPIPTHLQDAHYKGAAKLGHGTGYKYAHDYPNDYVEQQYLPYELSGREFYQPSGNGYEVKIREHMARIKKEAAEASSENKES